VQIRNEAGLLQSTIDVIVHLDDQPGLAHVVVVDPLLDRTADAAGTARRVDRPLPLPGRSLDEHRGEPFTPDLDDLPVRCPVHQCRRLFDPLGTPRDAQQDPDEVRERAMAVEPTSVRAEIVSADGQSRMLRSVHVTTAVHFDRAAGHDIQHRARQRYLNVLADPKALTRDERGRHRIRRNSCGRHARDGQG
jgi:hypothetical protein